MLVTFWELIIHQFLEFSISTLCLRISFDRL